MSGKIYLISKDGEPKYVGFTTKTLEERWKRHCRDARGKSQCLLHRAIRKYGVDAFAIELIDESPNERYALEILEPTYIEIYATHVSEGKGYNGTRGSEGVLGYIPSEDHKRKLSEALSGKTHSDNHKRKLSEAHKGKTLSPDSITKRQATRKTQYEARIAAEVARGTKQCSMCQVEKPFAEFGKDAFQRHGLRCYCRECESLRKKAKYQAKKQKPE